jgi:hypothetical protein
MPYTYITSHRTKHYSPREDRPVVKHIVVHGTDGGASCGEVCTLNWLVENPNKVSSHEFVYKNVVYRLLEDNLASHCVGGSRLPDGSTGWLANARTWNIEGWKVAGQPMDSVTRSTQLDRVVQKCRDFAYSPDYVLNKGVLFHREIDLHGKTCPGSDINADNYRRTVADMLRGGGVPQPPVVTVRPDKLRYWLEEMSRDARDEGGDVDVHDYTIEVLIPRLRREGVIT